MGAATTTSSGTSYSGTAVAAVGWEAPAPITVERLAARHAATILPAWLDLVDRALEPNPFLHPAFALPLSQHLMPGDRLSLVLVWAGAPRRLVGLFPLTLPLAAWGGLARGFAHRQVCIGTPLLDRAQAAVAFDALLAWLAHQRPRVAGLLLTDVPARSLFLREIVKAPSRRSAVEIIETRHRAVLRGQGDNRAGNDNVLSLASAKTRKERKRQMRRLAEKGARSYASARSASDVARACESFLALESRGWKGRRGSALLAEPARATFARSMMRGMAEAGLCRVDALETEGRAIAMGVVLTSGDTAYFWKTAFDQDYASLSPGVQFTLALTDMQLGAPGIAITDSCAVPDHPMINRIWPERMEICDIVIAPDAGSLRGFAAAMVVERLRRRLRGQAKGCWAHLRRLRPAAARSGARH